MITRLILKYSPYIAALIGLFLVVKGVTGLLDRDADAEARHAKNQAERMRQSNEIWSLQRDINRLASERDSLTEETRFADRMRIVHDTLYLAHLATNEEYRNSKLQALRDSLDDFVEVIRLEDYPHLSNAYGKQKELVFKLEKINSRCLDLDSIQNARYASLSKDYNDIYSFIAMYQKERCRVALLPFLPARGWIKKRCVERIKEKRK